MVGNAAHDGQRENGFQESTKLSLLKINKMKFVSTC
jgi:hypothetical protein